MLAAEDAREYPARAFGRAVVAPDSLVRRVAALAAGRIGDPRATPLLVPLLSDPDSTVRVAAAFALGLLRDDGAAVQPLIDRLTGLPALDAPHRARGGHGARQDRRPGGAGDFFGGVLGGKRRAVAGEPRRRRRIQIVLESWRLGDDAPVAALLPVHGGHHPGRGCARSTRSGGSAPRPAAEPDAARAPRSRAHRALARRPGPRRELRGDRGARAGGSGRSSRPARRRRQRPGADQCRSGPSAGYRDSALASGDRASCSTTRLPNVQVQAAETAGRARRRRGRRGAGPRSGRERASSRVRRAALVALGRADSAAFEAASARWRSERGLARARRGGRGHAAWRARARTVVPRGQGRAGGGRGPPGLGAAIRGAGSRAARRRSAVAARTRTPRCGAWRPMPSPGRPDPADLTALVRHVRRPRGRDSFPEAALVGPEAPSSPFGRPDRRPRRGSTVSSWSARAVRRTICSASGPTTTGPRPPPGGARSTRSPPAGRSRTIATSPAATSRAPIRWPARM